MDTKMLSLVRGATAPGNLAEDAYQNPMLNNRGDLLIATSLPERSELVRMGNSWHSLSATAIAPVAALPTTAAHLTLWNGEPSNGKTYLIDTIGSIVTTSAGAAINLGIAVHLGTGVNATFTSGTVATKSGLSGKVNYNGLGNVRDTSTITNDGIWHPVGQQIVCANTANAMLNVYQDVYGRYLVRPGTIFSIATLCNAAGTAVCKPFIIWHEVQLTLG